jgi:hypothetical protein
MKYQYIIFSQSLQSTQKYFFFSKIKVNEKVHQILLTAITYNIKCYFLEILKSLQTSIQQTIHNFRDWC